MARPDLDFITPRMVGATVTTSGSSAKTALTSIPTQAGTNPRYVVLTADTIAAVKAGDSTVSATANDLWVNGSANSQIVNVTGCTHIAYIQITAGAKLNIVPLEDM